MTASGGPAPEARTILDRLPVGVLVLDRNLVVVYANLAARHAVRPEKLRVGSRLPRLGEPSLEQLAARAMHWGTAVAQELTLGEERELVVEGVRDGDAGRVTLLLHDVSRRARAARAEHDFVVNAAHELLSPLTVISAASDVLRDGAQDDPETRVRFIAHIADAAARLTRVARAFLTLARAEAGVEPPRIELVLLRPVLEEVARVGEDDRAAVSCREDIAVLVERDLFAQALSNLVANARRHSGGDVDIVVDENGGGRTVGIEIVDTGRGILPEQLERLGDGFYSDPGRDPTGFGIGLSIAARSLEAFGARLTLTSEPGVGTRARVEVPSGEVIGP